MNRVVGLTIGLLCLLGLLAACTPAAAPPSSTPTTPASATPSTVQATATRPAATATSAPATATSAPATPTRVPVTATAAPAAPTTAPPAPPASGDANTGKTVFAAKGCSACHGPEAQGGIGPNLKTSKRTANEITTVVRSGKGAMPAYAQSQVSDAELQNIIAFLQAP